MSLKYYIISLAFLNLQEKGSTLVRLGLQEKENLIRNDRVFLCPLDFNKVQVRPEVSRAVPATSKAF